MCGKFSNLAQCFIVIYFFITGIVQNHKWENAMTIDKESWGYRRNAKLTDYLTTHELIEILIQTISCGGNSSSKIVHYK